jgi:hypothetical protein
MSYIRHSQCRICQCEDHKVVSDIDFDLLSNGLTIDQVLGKYGQFFGLQVAGLPTVKLNYSAVATHRKHIQKNVAPSLLGLPEATDRVSGELVKGERAAGFTSYIEILRENKETLETLLQSAFEDLSLSDDYLLKAPNSKSQSMLLMVRDSIRKNIAALTKQIQETTSPQLNNLNSKDNPQIVELLMIVKKAALLSIEDKKVRDMFMRELTTQIAFSKELRWMSEE